MHLGKIKVEIGNYQGREVGSCACVCVCACMCVCVCACVCVCVRKRRHHGRGARRPAAAPEKTFRGLKSFCPKKLCRTSKVFFSIILGAKIAQYIYIYVSIKIMWHSLCGRRTCTKKKRLGPSISFWVSTGLIVITSSERLRGWHQTCTGQSTHGYFGSGCSQFKTEILEKQNSWKFARFVLFEKMPGTLEQHGWVGMADSWC